MILKNFINYFNIIQITLYIIYLFIVNAFLTSLNIRNKFFLFLINYLTLISIGLYYSLDGLMMLFFVCELTVILVFIVLFSQIYTHYKESKSHYIFFFFFFYFVWVLIVFCGVGLGLGLGVGLGVGFGFGVGVGVGVQNQRIPRPRRLVGPIPPPPLHLQS